jgi:hypothetical protein
MSVMPPGLRAQLAADYAPVRRLRSPWLRALALLPLSMVVLLAAPAVFQLRPDAPALGWIGTWGASVAQAAIGIALVAAGLRESVPGRGWSRASIGLWIAIPVAYVVLVTLASWQASPVILRRGWWFVSAICLAGSTVTALPAVVLAGILAARAYPTRAAIAGALFGLGAGLMADAGWRLFCHFSEPAHVLAAHLGGVIISTAVGSLVATRLCKLR